MNKLFPVNVRLPTETANELRAIAKIAGLSPESVIKVFLAREVYLMRKIQASEPKP